MATPNLSPHVHGTTDEITSGRTGAAVSSLAGVDPAGGPATPPALTGNYDRMFKLDPARFGGGTRTIEQVQQLLADLAGTMFEKQNVAVPKAMAASATGLAPAADSGVGVTQSVEVTTTPSGAAAASGAGPAPALTRAESTIPAGYTYLGQFVDHDLTFDPISSLRRMDPVKSLVDFRTPALDLDSVYGRGPLDQPYLYEADATRLIVGDVLGPIPDDGPDLYTPRDLPRNTNGRAIIGDPRNDENVIVSQLHGVFLFFHNRLVRDLKAAFPIVKKEVILHYQWIVLYDFLKRVVNQETYQEVLGDILKNPPELRLYNFNKPSIPVEFSGAAYRFAHAMIRDQYRLNFNSDDNTVTGPFPIMGVLDEQRDPDTFGTLVGNRRFRTDWVLDWRLFFEGAPAPATPTVGTPTLQKAMRIEPVLSSLLARLPVNVVPGLPPSLAERDLVHGWRLGLPSGQAIAEHMKARKPLSESELLDDLPVALQDAFRDNAPLWYYVLTEAEKRSDGNFLGEVGGRIVMETIGGLLSTAAQGGGISLLREKSFKPRFLKDGNFEMGDLITAALKP